MIFLKKIYPAIALLLGICIFVPLFTYFYNPNRTSNNTDYSTANFIAERFGDVITNCPLFYPYIYNQSTVNISLGFTPAYFYQVEKCGYSITDSNQRLIDSSMAEKSSLFDASSDPFRSSQYVINKTLANLECGNYTFTLTVYYPNGTTRVPINGVIAVDTGAEDPFPHD